MIPEFTPSYWIFMMLPVRRLGHNPVLVRPTFKIASIQNFENNLG